MDHPQNERLVVAIAAVLKHHAVPPRLFGCIDQLPAILNGCGGRHFDGGMFAMLHAATAISTCQFHGVAMITRSRSSLATSDSKA
jgi:hypothetical protein